MKRLSICILTVIMISNIFCMTISHGIGDIAKDGKTFLTKGNNIDDVINVSKLESTSNYIWNILFSIGVMVAVIVSMILGIQFMAASAEEKAKLKEALLPFIVGCTVVFGSFIIWKMVVDIGNDAEAKIPVVAQNSGGSTGSGTGGSTGSGSSGSTGSGSGGNTGSGSSGSTGSGASGSIDYSDPRVGEEIAYGLLKVYDGSEIKSSASNLITDIDGDMRLSEAVKILLQENEDITNQKFPAKWNDSDYARVRWLMVKSAISGIETVRTWLLTKGGDFETKAKWEELSGEPELANEIRAYLLFRNTTITTTITTTTRNE